MTFQHSFFSTLESMQQRMIQIINDWCPQGMEGSETPIKELLFFRREAPIAPTPCLVEPAVVLVVQGVKQMWVCDEPLIYDHQHFLINSLHIPANSQVITASPENPCLGLVLKLDMRLIVELIAQAGLHYPSTVDQLKQKSMCVGQLTPQLLESFERLLSVLAEPGDVAVLAPMIQREIHYRLLKSEQAGLIWKIAAMGSQGQRIAKAIDWIKVNYAEPLSIDMLASHVQMSVSSLHHHFRQLTTLSPLQYQKWMRLNEAKRLMLNDNFDVASAAFKVGYESPSQFSREYSRLFGITPKRDILEMRRG